MPEAPTARPALPSYCWAILTLPFGLAVGFVTIAAPFALRKAGFDMTTIAAVSQVAQLPHVFKLLWSPALDAGGRRRTWYFGSVGVTAACLSATALLPAPLAGAGPAAGVSGLWIYGTLLFLAQAAVATSGSAVLALMAATVPDGRRGAASGFQTAGNLAGTAVGGALIAWMLTHTSPPATAATLAAICVAAAVPAAWIAEAAPMRTNGRALARQLLGDVWSTIRSRAGWTGLVICLSPVGTGALTNLFSALASDYAPSKGGAERLVLLVNGVLGGVANTAGAVLGGYLADRMNRRFAYALFGALTALCAVGMMGAPATPLAFTIGCLAYQLANGLCLAPFYAFVLELLEHRRGVATELALYVGASNFAISYVTWLDGWAYDHAARFGVFSGWSPRVGMLAMDATATFMGIAVLASAAGLSRRPRRSLS